MSFLKLASGRRLVVLAVVAVLALVSLATVAGIALGGSGQPPPARSLADAIHTSLSAPPVQGVEARVELKTAFPSDAGLPDGTSALLGGGSGRLWAAPGKLRLEVQSDGGDAQLVVNNGKGFVYDGTTNTVYTFTVPAHGATQTEPGGLAPGEVPSTDQIQQSIDKAQQHWNVSAPQPTVIADQPAYTVRATPRDNGGMVGAAEVSWDANHSIPLRVAVFARGQSTSAFELAATGVSYGVVPGSVFAMQPPAGAKVVDLGGAASQTHAGSSSGSTDHGKPLLFGKGLATIAVFKHAARGQEKTTALQTPLGSLLRFERGGVSYTIVGSRPLDALRAVARGL